MMTTNLLKIAALIAVRIFTCETSGAQRLHHAKHPHKTVAVVCRPPQIIKVHTPANPTDRLFMAMAYLGKHKYLTARRYAKMTKLSAQSARAELNSFARSNGNPIRSIVRRNTKVYTKAV